MLEVGKAGFAGNAGAAVGCRFFLGLVGHFVEDDRTPDRGAPRGGNSSRLNARPCESGAALLMETALLLLSGSTKSCPIPGPFCFWDGMMMLYRSDRVVGMERLYKDLFVVRVINSIVPPQCSSMEFRKDEDNDQS